jgi:hypothetical protein
LPNTLQIPKAKAVIVAVVCFLLGEVPATFDNAHARFCGDLAPVGDDPARLDGNLARLGPGLVSLGGSAKFGIDLALFGDDPARLDTGSSNSSDDPAKLDTGSAKLDNSPGPSWLEARTTHLLSLHKRSFHCFTSRFHCEKGTSAA